MGQTTLIGGLYNSYGASMTEPTPDRVAPKPTAWAKFRAWPMWAEISVALLVAGAARVAGDGKTAVRQAEAHRGCGCGCCPMGRRGGRGAVSGGNEKAQTASADNDDTRRSRRDHDNLRRHLRPRPPRRPPPRRPRRPRPPRRPPPRRPRRRLPRRPRRRLPRRPRRPRRRPLLARRSARGTRVRRPPTIWTTRPSHARA